MFAEALYLLATLHTAHPEPALALPEQGQIIEVVGQSRFAKWRKGVGGQTGICTSGCDPGPSGDPSADAGASLPITYVLGDECSGGCTVRYVAPTGSGSACTLASPCGTITQANSTASAGDLIVLRGSPTVGSYHLGQSYSGGGVWTSSQFLTKANLKLFAYPGETPVFDGVANITANFTTTEGSNKYAAYVPRPVTDGTGVNFLSQCANVNGGCSGPGLYPDQLWVDGVQQQQVFAKASLAAGMFWVDQVNSRLYLPTATVTGATLIEVSDLGVWLAISGSGEQIKGITVKRYAPTAVKGGMLNIAATADSFVLQNVLFDSPALGTIVMSGTATDKIDSGLFDQVSIIHANWMGIVDNYTKDLVVTGLYCDDFDHWDEYGPSPANGCLKSAKNYNLLVDSSRATNLRSQGFWFDQSNYKVAFTRNTVLNTGTLGEDSCVFFEISDLFYAVNNYIQCPVKNPLKLAGSSGLNVVNNTIVGGSEGIGIYVDSRSWPGCSTTGDGTTVNGTRSFYGTVTVTNGSAAVLGVGTTFVNQAAAGSTIAITATGQSRTVQSVTDNTHLTTTATFTVPASGSAATAGTCTGGFPSDKYMATSPARPATMTWIPSLDLMQNNVIVNPTNYLYCGPTISGFCIQRNYGGSIPSIPLATIIHPADVPNSRPQTIMDCDVFRVDGGVPMSTSSPSSLTTVTNYATGTAFGTAMAGASPFPAISGLEANSQTLTSTNVSATGAISGVSHTLACATPTDAIINAAGLNPGDKHFGVTWQ